jgi:hypothetical protein
MINPPPAPLSNDLDELTAVPFAVKDALRGLRRTLSDLPNGRSPALDDQSLSPLALAQRLIRETRKVAALGEGLARDILLHHRDEARILAFAASGFGHFKQMPDESIRHSFVASRYSAAKFVLSRLGSSDALVLEQPIDKAWRTLRDRFTGALASAPQREGFGVNRIAATAIVLAACGAISQPTPFDREPSLTHLTFAVIGLAEAVLSLSPHQSYETTLAALELSTDVMRLRTSTLSAVFSGFDPEAQLAAEYRLLASALAET